MKYIKITLKPGKEESFKRFHPWVFSGAIDRFERQPRGRRGCRDHRLERKFCRNRPLPDRKYCCPYPFIHERKYRPGIYKKRLNVAYRMRRSIGLINGDYNNTYRLVHGEGDNLSGLIIDIYDKTAVVQAHSPGMHYARHTLAQALKEVMGDALQSIYYKSETTLPYKAELDPENEYLFGENAGNIATEYGLKFHVDWLRGQKTGFFVDQRENRSLLEKYSKDRSVLNMFCYTGGFSFYAMRGGAKLVHSVDSSAKAIDLTCENVELNFPGITATRHLPKMRSNIWIRWETSMI